jgi:hypothetical protein
MATDCTGDTENCNIVDSRDSCSTDEEFAQSGQNSGRKGSSANFSVHLNAKEC